LGCSFMSPAMLSVAAKKVGGLVAGVNKKNNIR
jgi:hypothetical protein